MRTGSDLLVGFDAMAMDGGTITPLVIHHNHQPVSFEDIDGEEDTADDAADEQRCYCCNAPVKDAQLQRHNNPGQPLSCGREICPGARRSHENGA